MHVCLCAYVQVDVHMYVSELHNIIAVKPFAKLKQLSSLLTLSYYDFSSKYNSPTITPVNSTSKFKG